MKMTKITKEQITEDSRRIAKQFRKDIRNSKHGLLKILALESMPVIQGAILGDAGRIIGEPWDVVLPVSPIAIDAAQNAQGYTTPEGFWTLTKYAIGVALPYANKIYQAAIPLIDKL